MRPMDIDAIILAGGKGTRLREAVNDRPKPMAIVAGKPFAEWLLLMLYAQGIRRAVMCTGHMGEMIEAYFGNGRDMNMEIVYARDPIPLGTGGALRYAIGKTRSECFLVLNGDSYCQLDLPNLVKTHRSRNARASMSLVRAEDCSRYGSVKINKDGRVLAFLEKSNERGEGLINSGIYLMEREVVDEIPEGKNVSLEKELFPRLVGNGLYAVLCKGPFVDIGTPEAYHKAENILENEFEHLLTVCK